MQWQLNVLKGMLAERGSRRAPVVLAEIPEGSVMVVGDDAQVDGGSVGVMLLRVGMEHEKHLDADGAVVGEPADESFDAQGQHAVEAHRVAEGGKVELNELAVTDQGFAHDGRGHGQGQLR